LHFAFFYFALLFTLAVGIPMSLLGYIGPPIWLVWLGRVLVREADLGEPIQTPTSIQG
jgi:hypothetical protein